tara:strand:+ start:1812 stop:2300 length:489 start_codon:yes stop_codon:yes gene_type:complete
MALKPDRVEHLTDLSFFMNETGNRGGIVTFRVSAAASGAAMDDANAKVGYPTGTSAAEFGRGVQKPAGLLLNDVVNLDLTRQHINYHKDEVQKGSKVLLLQRGTVVTDQISGTPTAANIGATLYFDQDGKLGVGANASAPVGRLLSIKDADGYAKVSIDITW